MLYEKYRPKVFKEFIGQEKIIERVRKLMARPDWDRDCLLLCGPTGTGKTSLAMLIASQVADDWFIVDLDGDKCGKDSVHELEQSLCLGTPSDKWRVVIINECHGMTRAAVQAWLTLLERLPRHALVIFTTTQDIRADMFGDFSHPFASRCKVFCFTNQGLAQSFAARAKEIATLEVLDGAPEQRYYRLVQDCKNNFREVLQRIESMELTA